MSISSRAFSQQHDSFANKRFLTFERNLSKTQFSFERPKKTSKANFAFELTLHDFVVDDGLLFVRVEDQLLSDVRSKVSGLCKGQPYIQTTELWLFNKMVLWWWQRNFFSRLFFCVPRWSYNMTKMSQMVERAKIGCVICCPLSVCRAWHNYKAKQFQAITKILAGLSTLDQTLIKAKNFSNNLHSIL